MAQAQDELRARVADETRAGLRRTRNRLEQAGASPGLLDLVRDVSRLAQAELSTDPGPRQEEIEVLAGTLTPPEVMRHAEELVRQRYRVLHPLYAIWGRVADELNSVSHLPELTSQRPRDIRLFNNFQALAWAIIDQYHGRTGQEDQET